MTPSSEFLGNLSSHGGAIQVAPQYDFTCYEQERVLTLHEIEPSFSGGFSLGTNVLLCERLSGIETQITLKSAGKLTGKER